MTVLAIDQGTSATKAVVVAADGEVLSLAEASIRVVASPDGAVELDPNHLGFGVRDLHRMMSGPRYARALAEHARDAGVGRRHVERVVLTDGRTIECGLTRDPVIKGPVVDRTFRTSRDSVFAIGNLAHRVASADRCALDGRAVAAEVARSIA